MSRLFSGTPFDRPSSCPNCGKAPADCRCISLPKKTKMSEKPGGRNHAKPQPAYELTPENAIAPKDQVARLRVEKRKGNREATVITGLEHPANDLPALCTSLKTALGAGGAVKDRTIELQGDHATAAAELLESQGLKTRILR